MKISRQEAFDLLRQWVDVSTPICVEMWSIPISGPFLVFPVDDIAVSESTVAFCGPRESIFAFDLPLEESGGTFYYGVPSDEPALPSYIRESTVAAQLSETQTPVICVCFDKYAVLIHEHPTNVFFADNEARQIVD